MLGGFGLAYRDYFDRWANDPLLYGAMDGEYVDLAAYLRTLPDEGTPRVIAAETLDYPTIVYLTPAARDLSWVDPSQALLIPAAARAGGRLDYIVPDRVIGTRAVPPDWYAALGAEPRIEPFRNAAGQIIGKVYSFDLPPAFARGTFAPPALACGPAGANFNDNLTLLGWRAAETARARHDAPTDPLLGSARSGSAFVADLRPPRRHTRHATPSRTARCQRGFRARPRSQAISSSGAINSRSIRRHNPVRPFSRSASTISISRAILVRRS